METTVNRLGDKGIHTLIDSHQDAISRDICGEGMPSHISREILAKQPKYCFGEWFDSFMAPLFNRVGVCVSIDDYKYKKDEKGRPLITECTKEKFAKYCNSPESLTLFRALWYNHMGTSEKFVNFWGALASKFANNYNVMGFDPLNEPTVAVNHISKVLI